MFPVIGHPLELCATRPCVHQNGVIEICFQSEAVYTEPFRDIDLDVVFTSPRHRHVQVPAFWAGGSTWRVRFSSGETGIHTYKTRCSDTANLRLHDQVGEVEVQPYEGENPLYSHGGIKVSEDHRHFCHTDGTPFFWLGDTWWMGLCQRLSWPNDFQVLAQDRKQHGFNVVQLVAGLYPDMPLFDERGLSQSGFCWEINLDRINPAFFDEADQKIFYLVELGLIPCIVGAWGYYLPMIGLENMQRHWRYLIARWGALPVVWVAAGEQTMPWYLESSVQKVVTRERQRRDWSQVLAYMRTLNGFDRLITTHPVSSARESVTDVALLDFEMQQTNHALPSSHHAARAWAGWQMQPPVPVISAEARYEALEIDPAVTTQNTREAFWAHALNSGLAGHTYGANGIWQVNTDLQAFGQSPTGLNWGDLPWKRAMRLPGARQIGQAKRFLESVPWNRFVPQPIRSNRMERFFQSNPRLQRVVQKLGWRRTPPNPIAFGVCKEQSTALIYTITRQSFKIDLNLFDAPVKLSWIDPTNFDACPVDSVLRGSSLHVRPHCRNAAGDDDWLLLLQPRR